MTDYTDRGDMVTIVAITPPVPWSRVFMPNGNVAVRAEAGLLERIARDEFLIPSSRVTWAVREVSHWFSTAKRASERGR